MREFWKSKRNVTSRLVNAATFTANVIRKNKNGQINHKRVCINNNVPVYRHTSCVSGLYSHKSFLVNAAMTSDTLVRPLRQYLWPRAKVCFWLFRFISGLSGIQPKQTAHRRFRSWYRYIAISFLKPWPDRKNRSPVDDFFTLVFSFFVVHFFLIFYIFFKRI